MKIVVCIKPVLDPRGMTVNRKAEKVFYQSRRLYDRSGQQGCLEVAASIKAQDSTTHVIAMSVGTDRADDALREALARGADRYPDRTGQHRRVGRGEFTRRRDQSVGRYRSGIVRRAIRWTQARAS
ncbi:MAG: hypothetical protein U0559_02645 [Anaerolineae bacterium]